jgi:hypothetical protein
MNDKTLESRRRFIAGSLAVGGIATLGINQNRAAAQSSGYVLDVPEVISMAIEGSAVSTYDRTVSLRS